MRQASSIIIPLLQHGVRSCHDTRCRKKNRPTAGPQWSPQGHGQLVTSSGMYLFRGTRAGLAVGLLKHLSLGETTAGCAGPPPTVRGKKTKSERQRGHHKFLQLAGNSFSNFARATRSPFVRQRNTKPKSLRSCLLTDVRLCSSFCDRALRDLYTVALSAIEVFSVYVG